MNERLQDFVMRTSPWPPFRWAYAAAYGAAVLWLTARLRAVPEIRSLDLRLPRSGHCFGSSDLDLRAEIEPLAAPEFFALADRLARFLLPGGTWLRIFDVYLFPRSEYELQRILASQSSARDRRWIRLLGAPAPPARAVAEPRDASLGRVAYDYTAMGQELLEGPLHLHHTRLVYGRVVRIDEELRARAVPRGERAAELADDVLAAARGPVARGRVRRASFAALARAHAFALAEATTLARAALDEATSATGAPPYPETGAVDLADAAAPPDTLDAAVRGCRAPIAELCAATRGMITSALLGGVPGCRYEYRIYLLVRDDLGVDDHVELCRALRRLFAATETRIPYEFFRLRYPVILTPPLWRAAGRWYHALRPVEEQCVLERHGVVLWGDDARAAIVRPDRGAVHRSAAIGVADLRNRIWGALYHRRPKQLADLIVGRLPALWLALARSRVATSPAEAIAGSAAGGFPRIDVLAELYGRLLGSAASELPAVDDAVWRPALDALTAWLDDLATMALAAVATSQASP